MGKKIVKLKLTTLPHLFIHIVTHVVCQLNSIVFATSALAGVSFSSRGSDSASCPYRRSPSLLQQRNNLPGTINNSSCRCTRVREQFGHFLRNKERTYQKKKKVALERSRRHRPIIQTHRPAVALSPHCREKSFLKFGRGGHVISPRYGRPSTDIGVVAAQSSFSTNQWSRGEASTPRIDHDLDHLDPFWPIWKSCA